MYNTIVFKFQHYNILLYFYPSWLVFVAHYAQCALSLKRLSAGPGFNPQTGQNKLFQDYWRACFELLSPVTGTFVPRNFRSQEPSFPKTFVPMTDIKGELSFPNIGYYCLVMILKRNLNS